MTTADPGENRWLFGPARDLLFGCGLLYVGVFAALVVVGPTLRVAQPLYLAPLLILLISTPHYGATLLRVYEQREERRAYAFFTVWVTLALCALFVVGVYDVRVATVLLTVYLTWSPWHYTGQNYGIAVMFLRRRGIDPSGRPKQWLYASFFLSYALTFLVMHTADGAPADLYGERIHLARLGIPKGFSDVATPLVGVAYLVSLTGAAVQLLRLGSARDLLPVAALCASQALWFTLPDAARFWNANLGVEALGFDQRAYYFNWIVLAHAVQYLWVTSYYAKATPRWRGAGRYFGKTLLAGNAAWMLPSLLFAPRFLGGVSEDLGMGLLVASLVNIHHFVLDGAIWKLRSTRIADVLIRSRPEPIGPSRVRGRGGPAWAFAVLLLLLGLAEFRERELALRSAMEREDHAGVRVSLDRLAWTGKDSAQTRLELGHALLAEGDAAGALEAYERSLELEPGQPEARAARARLRAQLDSGSR